MLWLGGCSVRGVLFLLVLSGFVVCGLVVGEVLCYGEGIVCRVCVCLCLG